MIKSDYSSVMDLIEIPLSKRKLIWMTLGSIVFCGFGIWFLVSPPNTDYPVLRSPAGSFLTGLVTLLFFGIGIIVFIRKLLSKKPGFIISHQGITDNSSGISANHIPWEHIQQIKELEIMNQRCIIIVLKKPEEYLEKVRNPLKRKTMQMNYKIYGSPISISANSLKINFQNLKDLLMRKMKEYKC